MKIYNAEFISGATLPEQFPNTGLPEVAFTGRSNVGKSSLLNSLIHRKNLARISSTPGKTQQINFYNVDLKWCFVDLPGFGYASVSKEMRKTFLELNLAYLERRVETKLTCVLVDIRHDPMDTDLGIIELLENSNKNYVIVLTKADKVKEKVGTDRKKQMENLTKNCKHVADIVPYSSVVDTGRSELLGIIRRYCE